jgi:23S rRNA (uracil1939-C5)-methyltransferase
MSLTEGQDVALQIDKPVPGGRMIARHEGQVVLVRGAIPGERVVARVERAVKRLAYAVVRDVVEASADRRPAFDDPLCGGALYSHIAYGRQLAIKSDVIRDAFTRLGKHPLEAPIEVAASPEEGYRVRARFHVHGAHAGFYREGTHQLCDAASARQLGAAAVDAVRTLAQELHQLAPAAATEIAIAENLAATERAAHVELAPGSQLSEHDLEHAREAAALRGISARDTTSGAPLMAGSPVVEDPLADVTAGRVAEGALRRHAESFFQGNRFLIGTLVSSVVDAVPHDGEIVDLYAGVGLFSVALAGVGRAEVTAVEGDRSSGADLRENARPYAPRLAARVARVEDYLASRRKPPSAIILDPPRTGVSQPAMAALIRVGAPLLVYVSCDPPTLARDARRLFDAGYRLEGLRAFDLFPNTPHVEALAVFGK